MVPLFDIKAQHQAIEPDLRAAFVRVLQSGHFILGPEVQEFERQIAEFVGVRHAIGVSSGTDAILLALMTLDVGAGDEVICPAFTFFATAGCVARVGAKPVFIDSCPVCFNLDVRQLEAHITSRTKAIIPVHLFGQTAEIDAVVEIARRYGLPVIEDAAQALGADHHGRKAGSMGTFGAFSFFPTKNLGGFGDGGMLVTHNDGLAERARSLRTHGAKEKYYHESVGANFRLDAMQAALLGVKLRYYAKYTDRRRANAAYYTEKLSALPGVRRARLEDSVCNGAGRSTSPRSPEKVPGEDERLILPVAYAHNSHIWNQYTVRVVGQGRRDALKRYLADKGIGSEVYYPVPLHRQKCFLPAHASAPTLPNCETLSAECLSLPIYPELSRQQLDDVVNGVAAFLEKPADVAVQV